MDRQSWTTVESTLAARSCRLRAHLLPFTILAMRFTTGGAIVAIATTVDFYLVRIIYGRTIRTIRIAIAIVGGSTITKRETVKRLTDTRENRPSYFPSYLICSKDAIILPRSDASRSEPREHVNSIIWMTSSRQHLPRCGPIFRYIRIESRGMTSRHPGERIY